MCRQNQLFGCVLMAFGVGLLIGSWMERGVLSLLLGVGIIGMGLCMLRRR